MIGPCRCQPFNYRHHIGHINIQLENEVLGTCLQTNSATKIYRILGEPAPFKIIIWVFEPSMINHCERFKDVISSPVSTIIASQMIDLTFTLRRLLYI